MRTSVHWAWATAATVGLAVMGCSAKMSASAEAKGRAGASSGGEAYASGEANAQASFQSGGSTQSEPDQLPIADPGANVSLNPAEGGAWSGAARGGYGGVVPGTPTNPEHLAAQPGAEPLVTWHGFQALGGAGSRIFIQTSRKPDTNLRNGGAGLELVLSGVDLPAGNSRLPLDTSFFNTPVKQARIVKQGGEVVVKLEMRADAKPTVRQEQANTGYWFTYLEFPAGNFQ